MLDECTSNLDAETKATILRNIWPLLEGKTVVIVTHRVHAIESLVDEVVTMSQGRVARSAAEERLGLIAEPLFAQPPG